MWVLNQDGNILINLVSGLRLAILPTNTKEGQGQLYGVVVQAPAEATQPLGRPMPTGFSNTLLLSGAPLEDCQNLLTILTRRLEAYEVTDCPILPPHEEESTCYVLAIRRQNGGGPTWVLDDGETAQIHLHHYVENNWRHAFGPRKEIPADRDEAIDLYFTEMAKEENFQINLADFFTRQDTARMWPGGKNG